MKQQGYTGFIGLILSIFLANWLIYNVGQCPPFPCLIPVWAGVMAPSGILAIGLGFTFRDLTQRGLGTRWTIGAIIIGAALSAWLSPTLALASGAAFLLSELLDMAAYTPLQKRNLVGAVIASNVVGAVVDSAVFLSLAFGSIQFIEGQVIGKLWMTIAALPVIWLMREKSARKHGFQ